jgi:hypothetical protein
MNCSLCDRRQADGLLSRGLWGHVHHGGTELHACPTCRQSDGWEDRVRATANGSVPDAPDETPDSAYGSRASGF